MRIIVLGGTRFIGRRIVHHLRQAGHDLLIVHKGPNDPPEQADLEHVHCDRLELPDHKARFAGWNPDAVVDTIAMTRAGTTPAIEAVPSGLRTVVLSSVDTYAAYGALMAGRATEPVPLRSDSPVRADRYPYKEMGSPDYDKLDVEDDYRAVGATILRLPFVYGPNDGQRREEFVLRRVRAGRDRIPVGMGGWLGSRASADEVGWAVALAIESEHDLSGRVFVLGEATTRPVRGWIEMILRGANADPELVHVKDDELPEDLGLTGAMGQSLLVDPSEAAEAFGWVHADPEPLVAESVQWHLANPPAESSDDFSADVAALEAADARGGGVEPP